MKRQTAKRRTRLVLSCALLLVVALSLAVASAERVAVNRFRLTLERAPREQGVPNALAALFQFIRLRTVGVVAPPPGTRYRVTAVAYSSTVNQTDLTPCVTAAGTRVRRGIIATNFLPLGTRLRIGDAVYVVEDRMNERYRGVHIIDVWHPTTAQAREFGVQQLDIEILGRDAAPAPKPRRAPEAAPETPTEARPEADRDTAAPAEPTGILGYLRAQASRLGARVRRLLSVRVAVPEEEDCLLTAEDGNGGIF